MNKTIYKNGKALRYGYTTGSCAAAATKAAITMMLSQERINTIKLKTPKGWLLTLSVTDINLQKNSCSCAIKKDSGDDPDITNGVLVYATVERLTTREISIIGGIGVGTVTKPGLSVPIGHAAINPVPYKMIKEVCEETIGSGIKVTISIPDGEQLAKKTFNPRLGIVGGLSVLGTTGIVEPMSEEAFKESLKLELNSHEGDKVVLAPGNYGRDYCLSQGVSEKHIFKISNFVGYMFEKSVELKKKEVLFVGHIGKLIKVAGGIFHTHSRVSDARLEILAAHLIRQQVSLDILEKILDANTTEEAVEIIDANGLGQVFQDIVMSIKNKLEQFVYDQLSVEVVLFSMTKGALAMTDGARHLLEELNA